MCFALAGLGAIGSILSAVGGIAGAMVSAAGAQQQAEAEARRAEYEAQLKREEARREAYAATEAAEKKAAEGYRVLHTGMARAAASGVTFEGSPLTVFGQTVAETQADIETEQWKGKVESQKRQDEATLLMYEAQNKRAAGRTAAAAAMIGGFGGIGKLFAGGTGSPIISFGGS